MDDRQKTTAVRLDVETMERLKQASDDFGLSMKFLVDQALREFLDNMIEPSEFRLTRPRNAPYDRNEDG